MAGVNNEIKTRCQVIGCSQHIDIEHQCSGALIDRSSGMIFDSDQGITWQQGTNYTMTSDYLIINNRQLHELKVP